MKKELSKIANSGTYLILVQIFVIGVLFDLLVLSDSYTLYSVFLLVLGGVLYIKLGLSEEFVAKISLGFFVLVGLLRILSFTAVAEKAAIWAVGLLILIWVKYLYLHFKTDVDNKQY